MSDPLLRWAGSKRKLLPLLQRATPSSFNRYVEPFVGSGVLFLQIDPSQALLGDMNASLIETYETVRDHPRAVWNRASSMSQEPDFYYELRNIDPKSLKKLDRAARFVYLNRFCFNGVYRTNRQGVFNVARGKGHLFVPDYTVFKSFADRLKSANLICGDFEFPVNQSGNGDFIYLDPPYALGSKRDRGEYGAGSFRDQDEDRLTHSLLDASDRGAQILLSYSYSPSLIQKLKGWHVHRLTVNRNVSGFVSARRSAEEMLLSNYLWSPS